MRQFDPDSRLQNFSNLEALKPEGFCTVVEIVGSAELSVPQYSVLALLNSE
jgi:hypothetical protein